MGNDFYKKRIKECKETKSSLVALIRDMPEGEQRAKKENELRAVKIELENWLSASC